MKLYKVNLRGLARYSVAKNYSSSYVVADNTEEAYQRVREFLDANDIGYTSDRGLKSIELLADSDNETNCLLLIKESGNYIPFEIDGERKSPLEVGGIVAEYQQEVGILENKVKLQEREYNALLSDNKMLNKQINELQEKLHDN